MRSLVWFTLGFGLACGAGCWVGAIPVIWLIPVCVLLLGAGYLLREQRKAFRCLHLILLGTAVGMLWFSIFQSSYLQPAVSLHEQEKYLTITITDASYETSYVIAAEGRITLEGKSYTLRAYFDEEEPLAPGDTVTGSFRFRVTTPEGLDSHHPGKGIFLMAYQRGDITRNRSEESSWKFLPARLRGEIQTILAHSFPADVLPFAKALLLGDTYDLDFATDTHLKLSGIRHVVAVSGLHISILYGFLCCVTINRRYLLGLLGIPALLLVCGIAGFTPSVCRASVMIGLMILSQLLDRQYDPASALSFAALVLLAVNPMVITSAGFQLSVASVAGILLFQPRLFPWLKARLVKRNSPFARVQNHIASGMSVTLSATSLTVPLSACYFGTVSLVSVFANLLVVWLVTGLFLGILLVCILSLLSAKFAVFLGALLAWPIRFVLLTAKVLASFPLAAVYTESIWIVVWLVFVYGTIGFCLLTRQKRLRIPGLLCVLVLCMALLLGWMLPQRDDCRITVLDVGQGQCILLQSGGRTFLVDCGGDNAKSAANLAAETLLSQGIFHLDGIIVTHYDSDHFDGIPYLLTRLDTDLLLLPDTQDQGKRGLLPETEEILPVRDTLQISFEGGKLTVFGPVYSGYSNENSLCVLFETEKCDILITGDRSGFGERMLLRKAELSQVDVLLAGHHGAGDSTTEQLLEAVRPKTVIISSGEDNLFGHPHEETLMRLEEFGCEILRTDELGTILYRR